MIVVAGAFRCGIRKRQPRLVGRVGVLVARSGDAIQEGDFVVVGVISPHSVKSSWCQKESVLAVTRRFNEKRGSVLAIRLGDVTMPSFLTDVLYAEGNDPGAIAQELTRAIDTHLKRAGIEVEVAPAEAPADDEVSVASQRAQAISSDARAEVLTLLDQIADASTRY